MMRVLLLPLLFLATCVFAQTAPLNDTGQTQCFQGGGLAACSAANTGDGSTHPRQDGRFGRDAQAGAGALTKMGSGQAGFDFTRICNSGEAAGSGACPADPALGTGNNDWACTRDNVTGLIWEAKTPANAATTFTFADASAVHAAAVNTAQLCGAADWRVPTRRELLSIVHHGRSNPAIDTTFFPNTRDSFYWSSDIYAPIPAGAWSVIFGNGDTFAGSQANDNHVRLVSGTMPPEPNPRFVDNPDGTVTDPATGLMWDRCSWGQTLDGTNACIGPVSFHSWQAALGIAVEANTDSHRGYNDWRLPNRTELESLVDITKATAPTIDTAAFPNTPPSGLFWSSTVSPNPAFAWFVYFNSGDTDASGQTGVFHVRLVRSGQSFDALAPAQIVINDPGSTDNQSATAGTAVTTPPSVIVLDANDNPVAGADVTFAVASGGGAVDPTTPVATDANGIATVNSWTLGITTGSNTLTATITGSDPAVSATFTATGTAPLDVAKTAAGSYDRTVSWQLAKTASPSSHTGAPGDDFLSNWTVTATRSEIFGNYAVTGTITVTNPNGSDVPFSLADVLDDGTVAIINCPFTNDNTGTAPANGSVMCAYSAAPTDGSATLNTATVIFDLGAGSTTAEGTAAVSFIENLIGDDSVTLSDPRVPYSQMISGTTDEIFPETFTCPTDPNLYTSGLYTETFTNTAFLDGPGTDLEASAEVTITCTQTAPVAPDNVAATAGNAQATVTWTAPTDDGGAPITGYTVTGDPGGSCSVAGTVTACTITGLTNGTEYTFTVVATNVAGDSPLSAASESVTPLGPPSGALQLQIEPVALGLIVNWVAPSDNGGTPILSYRADANPSCEVTALADEVPGQTAYSCTLGNLDPGREYTVSVTAINAVGETTVVAAAAVQPLPVIPIPTLGTWALVMLMLLMFGMALPVLNRPGGA